MASRGGKPKKPRRMATTTLYTRIPQPIYNALSERSLREGKPISYVVREAMEWWMKYGPEAEKAG